MGDLLSAAWNGPARPLVPVTVGDLEWWIALGGPDVDWSTRIRIWELEDRMVAWCWFKPPAEADWFVAQDLGPDDTSAIRDEILEWHQLQMLRDARRLVLAGSHDGEPPALETWAADRTRDAAFLTARGWTAGEIVLTQYHQPLDVDLDPPRVPEGYVLRTMHGPVDIPARVEVHRAAFAPSAMTVEKYTVLRRQDHYAFDRDVVVEAPDGAFAAFAMCWADPVGSVGEFEPVGVHPDHQRRGLGRVVMRHGLRLLREAGLRDAIVFSLRSL